MEIIVLLRFNLLIFIYVQFYIFYSGLFVFEYLIYVEGKQAKHEIKNNDLQQKYFLALINTIKVKKHRYKQKFQISLFQFS